MALKRTTITPTAITHVGAGEELLLSPKQFDGRRHVVELVQHYPNADEYRVKALQPLVFKVGDTFTKIGG